MIRSEGSHYLISQRLVHAAVATTLLVLLLLGGAAYALAGRWLPEVERALDVEAPLANPDVVVLPSTSRSQAAVRTAQRYLAEGAQAVVLLGRPFSPDDLAPAKESRQLRNLLAVGVPRARIVEIYDVEVDLYAELEALAPQARERGWRRALFLLGTGGSRRHLLAARSILGAEGIAVGQLLFADDEPEVGPWWRDAQLRGRVMYNWILLLFGRLVGRY